MYKYSIVFFHSFLQLSFQLSYCDVNVLFCNLCDFTYSHVILPPEVAKILPKNDFLSEVSNKFTQLAFLLMSRFQNVSILF